MNSVVSFPEKKHVDPLANLKQQIQNRFGVSLCEYAGYGNNGKRSPEVQSKIERAMKKETLKMASKLLNTVDH
ncbi:hypothetical protein [Paenibacillus campinasensis]|uniref:Small, acid-soluble spore protein, alpha/beta type n=1 Tax=Paenibacillus campinasensis TaxID=66347 RepID=A0A268EIY6_9BACL|nr:hypothetical protein [Paenibacillus campinasensis]PAD73075.1 hypothetical protein CHH67_21080 [Paenibacillus campinasensis]